MTSEHERFMRLALDEATQAVEEGNPPYGSVIVLNGDIIARGHNLVNSTLDVTAHAETVALRNAGPSVGAIEFPGATLYATWEPCPMCLSAITSARVSTLVLGGRPHPQESQYGDYSVEALLKLTGRTDRLTLVTGILQEQCEAIVSEWHTPHRS